MNSSFLIEKFWLFASLVIRKLMTFSFGHSEDDRNLSKNVTLDAHFIELIDMQFILIFYEELICLQLKLPSIEKATC